MVDSLHTAILAAQAGGRVLAERAGDPLSVRAKRWTNDLVTEVDIEAGVAVVEALLAAYPTASIIIEEDEVYALTGTTPGLIDDETVWIIDPLDGTTSFVHGYPCYSVSVAYAERGTVVAGAVHNAALAETFSAARGHGAHLDGRPISASAAADLTEALLITGFPYDRGAPLERQLKVLSAFLRGYVHGIRRDGSAANDCCYVAAGRADGFWEYYLKPWDMAAGALIAEEAGCLVTDVTGEPWSLLAEGICIASPTLHAKMIEVILAAGGAE